MENPLGDKDEFIFKRLPSNTKNKIIDRTKKLKNN
jgi:hypothetical protein